MLGVISVIFFILCHFHACLSELNRHLLKTFCVPDVLIGIRDPCTQREDLDLDFQGPFSLMEARYFLDMPNLRGWIKYCGSCW